MDTVIGIAFDVVGIVIGVIVALRIARKDARKTTAELQTVTHRLEQVTLEQGRALAKRLDRILGDAFPDFEIDFDAQKGEWIIKHGGHSTTYGITDARDMLEVLEHALWEEGALGDEPPPWWEPDFDDQGD